MHVYSLRYKLIIKNNYFIFDIIQTDSTGKKIQLKITFSTRSLVKKRKLENSTCVHQRAALKHHKISYGPGSRKTKKYLTEKDGCLK